MDCKTGAGSGQRMTDDKPVIVTFERPAKTNMTGVEQEKAERERAATSE